MFAPSISPRTVGPRLSQEASGTISNAADPAVCSRCSTITTTIDLLGAPHLPPERDPPTKASSASTTPLSSYPVRRPESDWIRRNDDALVIVDPFEWERAQTTRKMRSRSRLRDSAGRIVDNRQGGRKRAKSLLTGWLQCDDCGSAFNALYRNTWGCGHRYNRGIEDCQNSVRIPQGELEDRVLGGLEREFLTPEHVDYVVEQAVRIVLEERSDDRTRSEEQRLCQLEGEIDNLIELAATQGTNDRVALAIRDREREVAEIKSVLARRKAPLGSEALAARVRRTLIDLGNMFRSSPEDARKALGALLGENASGSRWTQRRASRSSAKGCCVSVVPGTGLEPARPKDGGS